MFKTLVRFAAFVLVALLAAACGGVPRGLSDANGLTTGSGNHSVTIINNTGEAICYILMSESTETSWGDDHLSQTQALSNGGRYTIRVSSPGEYDIMVLPCVEEPSEDSALDREMGLSVDGDVEWTAGG